MPQTSWTVGRCPGRIRRTEYIRLNATCEEAMILELTDHAAKRAQQRGVSHDTIRLISELADQRTRVPGGRTALAITERARQRWINGGLPPTDIDRASGVILIADM